MYVMTIAVAVDGAPTPVTSTIEFRLPGDATDEQAVLVARGVRRGFRDAYDTRVQVIGLQEVGMTRDITLGA
jgi:hypothetical protein